VRRQYSIPERLSAFGVAVAGAAAVWPLFTATTSAGLPCPLRWVTGVPCPFCGLTTAAVDLVHGDPVASLGDNPVIMGLAILTVAVAPLIVLRTLGVVPPPKPWSARTRRRVELTMLAAVAVSWVFQLHRFGFV
jgi:hypothetical protein